MQFGSADTAWHGGIGSETIRYGQTVTVITAFLDFETYCEVPLSWGTSVYSEKAEVIVVSQAINDGDVQVFDLTAGDEWALPEADEYVFHNSFFDRTVGARNGIVIPVEKITDTMIRGYRYGLPGALADLGDVLRVPLDKQKDRVGKQLIQLFCKPRGKKSKIRRATRLTHPNEWMRFLDYCRLDIVSMRECYKRMPTWNDSEYEHAVWLLDQKINDRGICIDMDLVNAAIAATSQQKTSNDARLQEMTEGEVRSAGQRDRLMEHLLNEYGIDLPDLRAETLETRLEDPDLPEPVRELMLLRLSTATTSCAKYPRIKRAVSSDGRLRGAVQYGAAARTLRWGGRVVQPHNLPRPTLPRADIEFGIEALKLGCADALCGDVMQVASNALRGVIVAPKGRKLIVADLSGIEGRKIAWLADEKWRLQAYRDLDAGHGADLYNVDYAATFGIDVKDVTKDQRQIGKVITLALGFQGAVGAFAKMAQAYGVELPEKEILRIVKTWRKKNSCIRDFWYALDDKARAAINVPGREFAVGDHIVFVRYKNWLLMRLPSGRYLNYPSPRIEDDKITFAGRHHYTHQWQRITTYGGKLSENATQASSRDVFAEGMLRAELEGYEVVLGVHDELICEVPDTSDYTAKGLAEIMATVPEWCPGLPLAAKGFECYRYHKE